MATVDEHESTRARVTVAHLAILVAAVVAGIVALAVQDGWVADRYMTDDAFISFRYARHLADGVGPVWSPGDRVEGYTNFGWVLAIAVAIKAGFDPVDASRALGLAATVGILAAVPFLAAEFRERGSAGWWALTLGAIAALSLNTALSLWTFAGLETTAFALFVTLGITALLREQRREGALPLSAVLLLVAALIRPDGVVFFGVAWAWRAIGALRARDRGAVVSLAAWTAAFAVPFAVYWGWRWGYYGDFFPNTYYLKTGSGRAFYERGARYAWDFFAAYWVWLGAGVAASIWRERGNGRQASLFGASVVVVWFAYVMAGGGDWMPYFRFFVPVLPLLYVLILHGLIDVVELASARVAARDALRWAAIAAALVVVAGSSLRPYDDATARDPSGFRSDILPGSIKISLHQAIGEWFRDNVPEDYTIAQIATGIVPYYSERKTLDMLGVNDRHIAHLDKVVPNQPAGHEKQDGAYVLLSKPEVIWLTVALEGAPRRTPEDYMPPIDGRIAPVITTITQNLYVWVYYRPVAVPFQDGWLNLLVRRDAEIGGVP